MNARAEPLELPRDMRMEGVYFCQARPGAAFSVHLPLGNYTYCLMVRVGKLSFEIDYPTRMTLDLEAGDIAAFSGISPHALRQGPAPLRASLLRQEVLTAADDKAPVDLMIGVVKDETLALSTLRAGPVLIRPADQAARAHSIWSAARMLEEEYAEPPSLERTRVVRRLAEIMAINISRHMAQTSGPASGAEAEVNGRIVDALDAFFAAPGAGWTLAKLSRVAGMSRTRFIEGFKQVSGGQPPLKIMSRIRLSAIARRLVDDNLSIDIAAEEAGYGSAAAFIRAFQREFGETPARWRRRQRTPSPTAPPGPRPRRSASKGASSS